ncbi:MAG: sugar phosphate nucleotidyltransferase [Candidatus Sumerlaeales bacterium]|nr:sugar phosphate nucleotidyltransferase [Candidatus Sumerlaeales bacterium]
MKPYSSNVLPAAIILGGGRGTRLYPLTHDRCKPAVPLAGKYRLIDIALSNCINSHLKEIYVITQFNSASLNQHIAQTYRFDQFTPGFVHVLAASQTGTNDRWHQGTADAVRSNLEHLMGRPYTHFIILPGDSLCRMDYRKMLRQHVLANADLTICCCAVDEQSAPSLGIISIDQNKRILSFHEKPAHSELSGLESAIIPPEKKEKWIGSMGMYIFNRDVLQTLLNENKTATDLSKDLIPPAVNNHKFMAYLFDGFWRDIGTIPALFQANLHLLNPATEKEFRFSDSIAPIYTRMRDLPSPEITGECHITHSIISDGTHLSGATIDHTILGLRSLVRDGCHLSNTVIMGNDYLVPDGVEKNDANYPPLGIGEGTVIRNAIVDKNARVGKNCRLVNANNIADLQAPNLWIRSGIIVIPKNAIVPDNTEI